MNAATVVNRLLEDGFGYGQQEKPEHWEEVPYGYNTTGPDKRIEAKWDAKAKGYRSTVYWKDDYTGKERSCPLGVQRTRNPEAFMAQEQERFTAAGWDFTRL